MTTELKQGKHADIIPIIYAAMTPDLQATAANHGYALAIHGSMKRDYDLIAVPWFDVVSPPEVLIAALAEIIPFREEQNVPRCPITGPEEKPHGRMAWTIPLACGMYLDVSVMPRIEMHWRNKAL